MLKTTYFIFPIFNELNNDIFFHNLNLISSITGKENIVIVDGGSTDACLEKIKSLGLNLSPQVFKSRGSRIDFGLNLAKQAGRSAVVVHPRSRLSLDNLNELTDILNQDDLTWGGWTHQFDASTYLFKFTSWYSNFVRFDLRKIIYFDHCWFFSKSFLEKLPAFPCQSRYLFEDSTLSLRSRKITAPIRLKSAIATSTKRFNRNGFLRQALLNFILKIGFFLGVPDAVIYRIYEKSLWLNGKI